MVKDGAGRHRRRVHRPADAGPALERRPAPGDRGQGETCKIENENQTLATITFQNYFRMYKKLAGMTGTADTEAEEFEKIYKLDVVVDPDQPADDPHGLRRRRLPDRARRSSTPWSRRSTSCTRRASRCWWARSPSRSRRQLSHAAQARGHPAQRAQRQAPRAGGRDRRPGRAQGRGDHRHQHGRPRHGHHARRQPRVPGQAAGRPDEAEPGPPAELLERSSGPSASAAGARGGGRPPAGCTSWAPSATRRGASTTSCAAAPAARATPAPRRFYLSPGGRPDAHLRPASGSRGPHAALGMEEGEPIEHGMVTRAIENAQKQVEAHNFEHPQAPPGVRRRDEQAADEIYGLRREILEGKRPAGVIRPSSQGASILAHSVSEPTVSNMTGSPPRGSTQ